MKNISIILLLLITVSVSLFSMDFIDKKTQYTLSIEQLKAYDTIEISTHRFKDGENKDDIWIGVPLKTILNDLGITDFQRLKVIAADNYMVRYDRIDISDEDPIIALKRNGNDLNQEKIRLIAPSRRDMFWLMNIATIATEEPVTLAHPESIFLSQSVLKEQTIVKNPKPFVDVEGYYLRDVMTRVFPILSGEFLLMGKDGVRHLLDYDKYLSKAVIIITGEGFYMKSPQMPGGMWIQNLAYIQQDETALLISESFDNLQQLSDLLDWEENPEYLTGETTENKINIQFNTTINWQELSNLEKLEW